MIARWNAYIKFDTNINSLKKITSVVLKSFEEFITAVFHLSQFKLHIWTFKRTFEAVMNAKIK